MSDERSDQAVRYWRLWREDDHGNRFLVCERLTEAEARALQSEYERRGHKQLYWIERAATDY